MLLAGRVLSLDQVVFTLASENRSAEMGRRLDFTAALGVVSILRTPCSP
jgi:hypothetical protein